MIGIMGGTFNPIHFGHLIMCEKIREEFQLGKIIFIPAKTPPHKDSDMIIEANCRFDMVKLAICNNPYFDISDIEMKRQGPSYTIDTLNELKRIYGQDQSIGLIIGADSLVQIVTWKRFDEIIKLATIIVAHRPDTDEAFLDSSINEIKAHFGAEILLSGTKALDFSSTEIRDRVQNGLSIRYLVPQSVEAYIYERKLYCQRRNNDI